LISSISWAVISINLSKLLLVEIRICLSIDSPLF
jgi:hypothetical protein